MRKTKASQGAVDGRVLPPVSERLASGKADSLRSLAFDDTLDLDDGLAGFDLVDTWAADEPPEPDDVLGAYLVRRVSLYSRLGVVYLTARSWRARTKRTSLDWLKDAKRTLDPDVLAIAAEELTTTITGLIGPAARWTVVNVPCGHSCRHDCFGKVLAQQVADLAGAPFLQAFADRFVKGSSHPKEFRRLPALEMVAEPTGPVLLVDDLATSGWHLHEGLTTLRDRGITAVGLAWIGGEVNG